MFDEEGNYYNFPCSLCESSTDNPPFKIGEKIYVICNSCYDVISYVVKQILKDNKR